VGFLYDEIVDPGLGRQTQFRHACGVEALIAERSRPADGRSRACISLPGTSGSGSHSSVLTFEQNTPGCGSITTLLPASAADPGPDRTESARSAYPRPENGSRPVTGVRPRPVRKYPPIWSASRVARTGSLPRPNGLICGALSMRSAAPDLDPVPTRQGSAPIRADGAGAGRRCQCTASTAMAPAVPTGGCWLDQSDTRYKLPPGWPPGTCQCNRNVCIPVDSGWRE
jgi:hypothetical protein